MASEWIRAAAENQLREIIADCARVGLWVMVDKARHLEPADVRVVAPISANVGVVVVTEPREEERAPARRPTYAPRNAEEYLVCRAAMRRILRTMRAARASGKHPPWRWRDAENVGHHLRRAALHAVDAATGDREAVRATYPGEDVAHAMTRLAFAAVMGEADLVEASDAPPRLPRDEWPPKAGA